jgi:hypothetical protein
MMRALILLVALLTVTACTGQGPTATLLSFTETGPDGSVTPVRMVVNKAYLRIEDGDGKSGFIIFDRVTRTIYSVNAADQTTLVLKALPVTLAAPKKFEHTVERDKESLPAVDGKAVTHYRLFTNRERCFDVYAAEGLLPEAVAALREYHETLAGEQAIMQANVPKAFESVCDLADQVFVPARHLQFGFPVRQVNRAGMVRQLVDIKPDVPAAPGMFMLPINYKQITPADVRAKK